MNWLKQLKLKTRIIGIISILLLFMILITAYSISKMHNMLQEINAIGQYNINLTQVANTVREHQLTQARRLERIRRFYITNKQNLFEKEISAFNELKNNVNDELREAKALLQLAINQQHEDIKKDNYNSFNNSLENIEKVYGRYQFQVEQLFQLFTQSLIQDKAIKNNQLDDKKNIKKEAHAEELSDMSRMIEEVEKLESSIEKEIDNFQTAMEKFSKSSVLSAQQEEEIALNVLISFGIFSIIFAFITSTFISMTVTKSLKMSSEAIENSAQGTADSARQLALASQSSAHEASNQASSIEEISSSLEELNALAKNNYTLTLESYSLVEEVTKISQNMDLSLNTIDESTIHCLNHSQQMSKLISQIIDHSKEIKLLAITGEAIKNQVTNPLAITQEVKKLAEIILENINQLNELVNQVQQESSQGKSSANDLKNSFHKKLILFNSLNSVFKKVTNNTEQQTSNISEINLAISHISTSIQATASSAEDSASASEELASQAELMFEMTKEIKKLVGKSRVVQEKQYIGEQLIVWDKSLSVKIKNMDDEHKVLIDLINELFSASRKGKTKNVMNSILSGLLDYTKIHFAHEEELLEKYGYPGITTQKAMHKKFVDKIIDTQAKFEKGEYVFSGELMSYLKDWLTEHIKGVDSQYIKFFHSKGIY